MSSFRNFDKEFAVTNELRVKGTDYLLEAAQQAGTRRFIAQSFTGWNNARTGGPVKTEQDPLDPDPVPATRQSMAAIKHVEQSVPGAVPEGLVLRYGSLYGHGASDNMLDVVVLDIADGQVQTVRSIVNPDKLHHLGPVSDVALRAPGDLTCRPWPPTSPRKPRPTRSSTASCRPLTRGCANC